MDPINPIAGNPEALNQNPVTPETPKDNHGITIAAMAVFVLLSLGAVAFLYYQNQQLKSMLASYQNPSPPPVPTATTDPTANWKTYIDKVYSYSIQYPDGWFVDSSQKGQISIANFAESQLSNQEKMAVLGGTDTSKINITLAVYGGTISNSVSLINWLKNSGQYVSAMCGTPTSSESATIANSTGLVLMYKGCAPSYVFSASPHVYNASFSPANSVYAKTFDQILSTFQFTSPSPSPVSTKTPVSSPSAVPNAIY